MKGKLLMVLFFTVALVSCGGGGGSGGGPQDYVTITIDSGAPYTYTETPSATSPLLSDPYIWSTSTGTTSTRMYIHEYNGSKTSTLRMEISIKGTATGTYNISDGNYMLYMPAGGPTYSCWSANFPETSGTITINEFGPTEGGKIKGTLDEIATTGTTTAHLTGSFTITRH